jgi:hypothetical protein
MRLPLRSWDNTLKSMGFRKRKHANERPARRFAFESLEDRRVRAGLSPVLTTDLTAAKTFWSEQLATGSPLLSGPVTDFGPAGPRPVAGATPPTLTDVYFHCNTYSAGAFEHGATGCRA